MPGTPSSIFSGTAGRMVFDMKGEKGYDARRFEADIKQITSHLIEKQKRYDRVAELTRDTIRAAALSITELHNNSPEKAKKGIASMAPMLKELQKLDAQFKHHSVQAYQEYAEAKILYTIKTSWEIPPHAEVGVEKEAYVLGLMDVMGELKREVIENLRAEDYGTADKCYGFMRSIYDTTRGMRFAESVLGGFRRKQDVARIQLESAGSEILFSKAKRRASHRRAPSA